MSEATAKTAEAKAVKTAADFEKTRDADLARIAELEVEYEKAKAESAANAAGGIEGGPVRVKKAQLFRELTELRRKREADLLPKPDADAQLAEAEKNLKTAQAALEKAKHDKASADKATKAAAHEAAHQAKLHP